jgi:hypothetical protein
MQIAAPITLRLANHGDGRALRRLDERDSAALPPGPHVVAIRDGELEAAISLSTGEIVADPFRHTAELCQLLRWAVHRGTTRPRPARPPRPRAVLQGRLA